MRRRLLCLLRLCRSLLRVEAGSLTTILADSPRGSLMTRTAVDSRCCRVVALHCPSSAVCSIFAAKATLSPAFRICDAACHRFSGFTFQAQHAHQEAHEQTDVSRTILCVLLVFSDLSAIVFLSKHLVATELGSFLESQSSVKKPAGFFLVFVGVTFILP